MDQWQRSGTGRAVMKHLLPRGPFRLWCLVLCCQVATAHAQIGETEAHRQLFGTHYGDTQSPPTEFLKADEGGTTCSK